MDIVDINRAEALAALRSAAPRVSALIRAITNADAPTKGLEWTLGQTAGHVVSDVRMHREWLRGEGTIDYGVPDLATRNRQNLEKLGESEPGELARLLDAEVTAFAGEVEQMPLSATIPAEVGPALTVGQVTCVLLGEFLVHGFDLATTLGRPWSIGRPEANLVAAGSLAILPQFVNESAARDSSVAYEVRLRDGPRVVVRIDHGTMSVEPSHQGARVDARISADPAAFLLVGYGRTGQWGLIARGKLLAWGRKPWTALRFATYLRNP
jgi:uncharacterized protein (TIGR03083 family)